MVLVVNLRLNAKWLKCNVMLKAEAVGFVSVFCCVKRLLCDLDGRRFVVY